MKTEDLKLAVKQTYGTIAHESLLMNPSSCCGPSSCCSSLEISMMGQEYHQVKGYLPEADLGLGCGLPTQFAGIKTADHVLDLGSGAGNDCFVSRAIVGETGRVTGLDFTSAMVDKAKENNRKMGFANVEFIQGDIEEMPFEDNRFDVIVSNCVLNLVPDKDKAFAQMMRVLKPGGHFCISDVVIRGELPQALRQDASMYVGCIAGASAMDDYMGIINSKGFKNITIHQLKTITIPENVLEKYLPAPEKEAFDHGETGIVSITVSGYKN